MANTKKKRKEYTVAEYAQLVQESIVSCSGDQPLVDDFYYWLSDSATPIEDLLQEHNVPEELRDGVIARLRCPKCGNSIERGKDVGTKQHWILAHESTIADAFDAYESQLTEFHKYLSTAPTLGASHPVGRRILRELKRFPFALLQDQERVWYQARKTLEHGFGLTPAKFVGVGRYNSLGQPRLYLAASPLGAVAEVCAFSEDQTAWVQEFHLPLGGKYLDLRSWDAEDERFLDEDGEYNVPFSFLAVALIFGESLTNVPKEKSAHIPEYNVTRFISDAAAQIGFSGIIYPAARHFDQNIVVLDASIQPVPHGNPSCFTLDDTAAKHCRDGVIRFEGKILTFDFESEIDFRLP